ncbi:MAG: M15 family metallopeptidase [Oscillospiraceae bacterium]|nr:M15 family metallopeptidase [Oscillospiraceae bacterium]
MKRIICLLLALVMVLALAACRTGKPAEEKPAEPAEWTRSGYYQDEDGNMLSVTWMDDVDEPGWYVGFTNGDDMMEDSYGGLLSQDGSTLHGSLPSGGSRDDITVTLSEEGEDGLMLEIEGGETYHFSPMDLPEATIIVRVNTEGSGNIEYTEGEEEPEIDTEYPYQSAQINLAEPAVHTFKAWPNEGWHFVRWTKNGEDFSTEAVITVNLDESADYIAVFEEGIDYLALVNKLNPLPDGWEDALETVTITNSLGDEVEVEAKAYAAYEQLKADLEVNNAVYIELDSARRSVAAQQDIMDRFIEKYGADYAAKTVAQPGYSEHHTGLALDLYFMIENDNGEFINVYHNEDMEKEEYKPIWDEIHAKLAEYGFILRYLEGEEHITGYRYEPWHIRYVDSAEIAREIMSQPGLTLEEYLAGKSAPEVEIDLSGSKLYSEEELYDAMLAVKCKFASWAGCELKSIRYAGDDANSKEILEWLNSLVEDGKFTETAKLLMDFHSSDNDEQGLNSNFDYKDYEWWLARTEDGDWEIVSWGY